MAIIFPLVQAPDPGGTPPTPKVGPGPRARILVVEDHEDSREMLRQFLEFEGYDVDVAADGRVGIDAALERPPIVALIDLGLPRIDGFEVARAIRERFGHDIWLVALTSRTTPADRRRSAEAGFDLHVAKPVSLDRLRGVLRDIVSRSS
jgi:two-component system, sensor histidine kinase